MSPSWVNSSVLRDELADESMANHKAETDANHKRSHRAKRRFQELLHDVSLHKNGGEHRGRGATMFPSGLVY